MRTHHHSKSVMVSSYRQFVYFKNAMSLFITHDILATNLDSVLSGGER